MSCGVRQQDWEIIKNTLRVVFLKVHVYVGAHFCYRGLVLHSKKFKMNEEVDSFLSEIVSNISVCRGIFRCSLIAKLYEKVRQK